MLTKRHEMSLWHHIQDRLPQRPPLKLQPAVEGPDVLTSSQAQV